MFRDAENEKVLMIHSQSQLLNDAKSWLIKHREGTIHTNRVMNSGWVSMAFDFSVTRGNSLTVVLCRILRTEECKYPLYRLLQNVDALYKSGIKQEGLPFALELILQDQSSTFSAIHEDMVDLKRQFGFLKDIIFLGQSNAPQKVIA